MLLKMIATGRDFGDKVEPKVTKLSVGGVACVVTEDDRWEGPTFPGGPRQYYRATWLETVNKVRDDRFSNPQHGGERASE
jgi:hypothetical protein